MLPVIPEPKCHNHGSRVENECGCNDIRPDPSPLPLKRFRSLYGVDVGRFALLALGLGFFESFQYVGHVRHPAEWKPEVARPGP